MLTLNHSPAEVLSEVCAASGDAIPAPVSPMGSTVQPCSTTAHGLHRRMRGRAHQDPGSGNQYTEAMGGQFGNMEGKREAQVERHGTGGKWEAEQGK